MSARAEAAARYMVPSVVLSWAVVLVTLLWTALKTGSVVAWTVCAIVSVLPALMLMVLAHTPAKTVAEIIRDVEAR